MSVYGYFLCHDCRQCIWLGKALHENHVPYAYHIGSINEGKHWKRPELNKIIWKFLADHTHHKIEVMMEHNMSDDMYGYQDIGGDGYNDISIKNYLKHKSNFYED